MQLFLQLHFLFIVTNSLKLFNKLFLKRNIEIEIPLLQV